MQAARSEKAPFEGELTDSVHIDTATIPDVVREHLASKTLERFKAFLAVPGNAEWLDARIVAKKAAQAAK